MTSPDPQAQFEEQMVREMEAHLAEITASSKGDLKRELEGLYLLAVEREELAVVGYGGDEIQARVERLEVEPHLRALVAHALRWASRDERTHVVLARGLLAGNRRLGMALQTAAANLGGAVSGWCTAVLAHTTLSTAPFSRALARVLTWFGKLAGKVPKAAHRVLESQSFASFCRFQVGAELTAAQSWERIAQLLKQAKAHPLSITAWQIAADERKHEKVLRELIATFDDDDRARSPEHAATLAERLQKVAPAFVRSKERGTLLGTGNSVIVREDPAAARGEPEAVRKLLRAALGEPSLFQALEPGETAVVKTSFMMAWDKRDPSPIVDPVLLEELAAVLREKGAGRVIFLEGPNHYDRFHGGRSVREVAKYLGLQHPSYEIFDASEDQEPHAFARGHGQSTVNRHWRDAGFRVVLGKMKTNPSWLVHLTMSTLDSLGRPTEELLFHDRLADLISGLMMLMDAFAPHLALLDATHHVPDGLTGILGDPDPAHPGRIYASTDALALDLVAARHMGISALPKGSALALALDWFDDPRPGLKVDGPDSEIAPFDSPQRNDLTVFLSGLSYSVYTLFGERGSYWMPLMDPEAFPRLRELTWLERVAQPLLRGLFGFGKIKSTRE